MVEEVKIDTNLYSRQIGTFGLETMGKLVKMKVLIVGMRGLGVEVSKNLILAGPGKVDIYDPTVSTISDLGSNFYLKKSDVDGGVARAAASIGQLKELNPYVEVGAIDSFDPASEADLSKYNLVCVTENFWGLEKLTTLNEACRAKRIGFLLAESLGPAGVVFSDFGTEHIVTDANGEQTKSFIVTSITSAEQGEVVVHEDKRHSFQDGDYVKFVEVEGMSELNTSEPIKITVTGPFSFKLHLDTSKFGSYSGQGVVEDVKVPKKVAYHSLAESIQNPPASTEFGMLEPTNMNHFGMQRSEQIHLGYMGIYKFQAEHNRYPENTEDDLAKVVAHAKAHNAEMKAAEKMSVDELDETIVKSLAAYSKCSISPVCAFMGGFVAQEIVKFTGKYSPLKQWLHFDSFESVPEGDVDRRPMDCRYDDQIKIYGREMQEKIGNVKTFMVGAGALGCEYAKAFAMIGLGCGPNGQVTVTDNDNIEVSNLNRQFLFRKNNVGKPKSETACMIAKQMNPDLKINPLVELVSPDTEHIFNDEFWESLSFIVNAVDNVKARLYVDSRCAWYGKGLLESGTLGTKANQQMIVPHVTQIYGDSQDPPEESIPLCTLRSFPNLIEHCIEWGRDIFEKLFSNRVLDAVDLLKDQSAWLVAARQSETSAGVVEKLTAVKEVINLKTHASMALCAQEARNYFENLFDHGIRDLKALLPDDHKNNDGTPFWSGPKRSPNVLTFDPEDPIHFNFAYNAANLVATSLKIEPVRDLAKFKEILLTTKPRNYVQKHIKVETPEEAKEREAAGKPAPQQAVTEDDEALITELLSGLKISTEGVKAEDILPAEFEKDEDDNFHIDFITACSNLRARNYRITEADRNKTKMIAGKIIPAIATTTAMVTGSVSTEIYKYVQGMTGIEKFKNVFINLALPTVMFTEPDAVIKNKSKEFDVIFGGPVTMLPEGYTVYDKIDINEGSKTIQELIDWFAANRNVEVYMISCGRIAVYNAYLPGNKHASRLPRKIEDVYTEINEKPVFEGRNYLVLEVMGSLTDTMADVQMPPIKYSFRQ